MNIAECEQITRVNPTNLTQIQLFLVYKQYIQLCQDPHNIFRYMQENVICTFLSSYWLCKAAFMAEMGEYSLCFQCIEEAKKRLGIEQDQSQAILNIDQQALKYKRQIIQQIQKYPVTVKRSAAQFELMEQFKSKNSPNADLKQLLNIYQTKYKEITRLKTQKMLEKRQKLPKSWMNQYYSTAVERENKIEQQIHQHSIKISKEVKCHSMHTPIRLKYDPQRLAKALDSVQVMKRRKSSRQKLSISRDSHEDRNSDEDNEDSLRMTVSFPASKYEKSLKKISRVTFSLEKGECAKLVTQTKEDKKQTNTNSHQESVESTNHKAKSNLKKNTKFASVHKGEKSALQQTKTPFVIDKE